MIKDYAECHVRDAFTDSCKPLVKPFIAHSLEIEGRRQQDSVTTGIVQNPRLLHGVANRRRRDTADYLVAQIDSSGRKRTENLPATWYDTPNIHFCTIKDFVQLCDEINVKMERAVALDLYGRPLRLNAPWWFWNMFGEQGVFLLSRAGKRGEPV